MTFLPMHVPRTDTLERPLSLLVVTTLFPNPAKPQHGSFVATRLQKLLETGLVKADVVAPVPWLPPLLSHPSLGPLSSVPRERRHGAVRVFHPRFAAIPKIGMSVAPKTLFFSLRRTVEKLVAEGNHYDLIDAHYFFPDGVAAVRLGREFRLPVVVTARGTDINLIPQYSRPRKMIVDAAKHADALISVCQALKDHMVSLGIPAQAVAVLRNGVDLTRFQPHPRTPCRVEFGFKRRTIGSVGWLIARKGHHHVIRALKALPETDLVIVGDGPDTKVLQQLAQHSGVADRVRFLGALPQERLARLYSALDALVLASSREGWANVLLESMACGTPVVASNVWGTPEVVKSANAGVLMHSLDAEGVADGVNRLFLSYPDRRHTRRYAEQFDWDATTAGQLALFRRVISHGHPKIAA